MVLGGVVGGRITANRKSVLQRLNTVTTTHLLCNRLCSGCAVTSLSGSDSEKPKSQRLPRRTKRTNYADREQLMFPDLFIASSEGEAVSCGSWESLDEGVMQPPQPHAGASSLRLSAFVLGALAMPLVGPITYGILNAMAYVGYTMGRVSFYTRYSVAPPLSTSGGNSTRRHYRHQEATQHRQHPSPVLLRTSLSSPMDVEASIQQLIAAGAYAQAAALSTTTVHQAECANSRESLTASDNSGTVSAGNIFLENLNGTPYFRGLLQGTTLDCIRVGSSPIHSRGLFTTKALPRSTRVVVAPQRTYMDAAQLVLLLGDTHTRLPDTFHYTHPTGSLMELVTQPLPHHLMNHSCEPNCCCGLSKEFWPAAAATGEYSECKEVLSRIENFPYFGDANSFFTTRDVPAGSELTISYSHRVAPLFYGENALKKYFVVCRCGSSNCRHFVYKQTDEVSQYFAGRKHCKDKNGILSRFICNGGNNVRVNGNRNIGDDSIKEVGKLLRMGYDDETVFLSLLSSRKPLLRYMQAHLAASRRSATKRELLMCYRHVFKFLNEASPVD
ncbi:hypothetical protein, conserved [Trypanosoma brucei gambiense DAL972]|uniref:SET domain-containing protein n=1 Tax=Trypanosoma brucei gambiense (strain MHOM/CI/86/DAL972) TaxID=679716 RepID=C9ZQA8_TRYB9|nr:LOW QUALITY PROTEIN: hypothetical protein, conserved [Trypanosoma brucei gambiense DAL972]CBH11588.1 hypothetical protein, conserved [Trypanosoma brucei gambiense DAL972]|eukprot:XP_011773873.1 LOW QUALITY PROTEIN: hypothetical protein, conserved [Trypanosoma brucei gambiense DAL972]